MAGSCLLMSALSRLDVTQDKLAMLFRLLTAACSMQWAAIECIVLPVQSTAADKLANGSIPAQEAEDQRPQSVVIVLECTEESVPWSTAVGSADACMKVLR